MFINVQQDITKSQCYKNITTCSLFYTTPAPAASLAEEMIDHYLFKLVFSQ